MFREASEPQLQKVTLHFFTFVAWSKVEVCQNFFTKLKITYAKRGISTNFNCDDDDNGDCDDSDNVDGDGEDKPGGEGESSVRAI